MIYKQNKIVNKNNTHKQTSISLIPNDWEVKTLGEVYNYINTPSFSRENLTSEKTENEVYYIHYGDIHSTFKSETLDFEIEKRVPFLKDEFCNANLNYLQDGDLVIADASEDYAGVGESIEIKNIGDRKVVGGLHTLVLRDKEKNTAKGFNTYIFRNQSVHNELKKIATGISVYGISKGNLSKIKIPLPPLPEQKAIAHILGLMDAAINTNNQLIAQKQQRKKWLMQNLLTGKKRLKGFNEEWKEVSLGDIGESYNGLTGKAKEDFGEGFPFITYMNIFSNSKIDIKQIDFVKIEENENQNTAKYGDIFFTVSSETPNEVGMASVLLDEVETLYLNSFCFGFRLFDFKSLVPVFAQFLLRFDSFREQMILLAQGSTRFNISKSAVKKIKILLPSIKEQMAIAQILQAADKEIQLLKEKTDKLKEQKKGLMQVLLTGKKRLKIL